MEPGFPKRNKITDRGNAVNYGGDGRYRYDLCPRARTVVVTDLALDVGSFTPLSVASTARVATINLTAGNFYHNICYRSITQEVWVFGTANVIVIDANPSSVNFNTIINTITSTRFSVGAAVVYSEAFDIFVTSGAKVKPDAALSLSEIPIKNITSNSYLASNSVYLQHIGASVSGNVNNEIYAILRHIDESVVHYLGISSTLGLNKIAGKYYLGINASYYRIDETGNRDAGISIITSNRGDSAYSQISSHIVVTNNNGTALPIISITPTFASVGNLYTLITSILATNHNSANCVLYSPFSKKIYVRPANVTSIVTTGLNRYYIFDTTQALANMACGYREIDEGCPTISGAVYNNSLACFNTLRINEYDF